MNAKSIIKTAETRNRNSGVWPVIAGLGGLGTAAGGVGSAYYRGLAKEHKAALAAEQAALPGIKQAERAAGFISGRKEAQDIVNKVAREQKLLRNLDVIAAQQPHTAAKIRGAIKSILRGLA